VVEPGPNLEARCRAARYGVLPPNVCTGHTADDQAETVILHLIRGSGTRGLAGVRSGLDHSGARRPLLGLRRAETAALCAALGIAVVTDPTNDDPRHRRNRVRAELVPLLSAVAERDIVPLIARQAELLRADDDLLDQLAAVLDPTDARALGAAPVALARRAVREWLTRADPHGRPPDGATVQRVLDVAAGASVACEVHGGARVARSRQRLTITAPNTAHNGVTGNGEAGDVGR
jgi:tRNA(Ile)-lysidine synthase